MNILGFDTGLNRTYIALNVGDEIFSKTINSTEEYYHSAFLIQETVKLLKEHNLMPRDINLITTNIGPGSFTGIRVGLVTARTFAQGVNAMTVGVNSLELISNTYGMPALTILDARKNKAYLGNSKDVNLVDLEDIPKIVNNFDGKIIADTKMQEFLFSKAILAVNFEKECKDYGRILIEIAKQKYENKEFSDWQNLKPSYIQPPPIHTKQ